MQCKKKYFMYKDRSNERRSEINAIQTKSLNYTFPDGIIGPPQYLGVISKLNSYENTKNQLLFSTCPEFHSYKIHFSAAMLFRFVDPGLSTFGASGLGFRAQSFDLKISREISKRKWRTTRDVSNSVCSGSKVRHSFSTLSVYWNTWRDWVQAKLIDDGRAI